MLYRAKGKETVSYLWKKKNTTTKINLKKEVGDRVYHQLYIKNTGHLHIYLETD
jgi:hypothetical protein